MLMYLEARRDKEKRLWKTVLFLFGLVFLFSACSRRVQETAVPLSTTFRVIGYTTEASIPELIPYEQLTHINYAFLIPNADGTVILPTNLWKIEKITGQAHEQHVKVLISVGGWGWDAEFETLAADRESRTRFVDNLVRFVDDYNLDGIDMDWEYPDPGPSAANFLAMMRLLREKLPEGKLLTAAVVAHGDENGRGIPAEAFEIMDFVNLMAYDGPEHGTMAQAELSLDYWLSRGLTPEKTVLGLPFYGHPTGAPYRKIVESDPQAAVFDEFDYLGVTRRYNGIPTIEAKTRLAIERASGVMFWTLEQDAQGELSLVSAIHRTLTAFEEQP